MGIEARGEQSRTVSPVRVFLLDDQAIIRAALRSLLDERADIEVVGDCGEPRLALEEIQRLRPDVLVLDIAMSEPSRLDVLPMVRKSVPRTRVVMLTHHDYATLVHCALKGGAEGYLSKDSDPAELAVAILSVQRGDPYVSRPVARPPVNGTRGGNGAQHSPSRLEELTPREREVLQLLAVGKSNKEVASALDISVGTAKKHRENLQRKVSCGSPAELARFAIREGLLQA